MKEDKTVKVSDLKPHPNQIRKEFDSGFLKNLSASIKRFGVVVPILALRDGTIVAGEQRWRAAKLAGRRTLKVGKEIIFMEGDLIRSPKGTRQDIDVINAIENIMRRNLNLFEEAEGLVRLAREYAGVSDADELRIITRYVQQGLHVRKYRKEIRQMTELVESMGISKSRAAMLVHLGKFAPAVRNYVMKHLGTSNRQFSVTKLFFLSAVPQEDQMMMAKAVVRRGIGATGIKKMHTEWKRGLRDSSLILKKMSDEERMKIDAWHQRRERLVAEMKRTDLHGVLYSWELFSMDINMFLNDLQRALDHSKKDTDLPRGVAGKIELAAKRLQELQEAVSNEPEAKAEIEEKNAIS